MPFAAAAAPALIGAGGAIGSALLGRRGPSKEEKRLSRAQEQQIGLQTSLARELAGYARRQYTLAEPAYTQALRYYMGASGAGGSAALGQALLPQQRQISDIYRGRERGLEESGVRGGARDYLRQQLEQQRTGQMAELTAGARQEAIGRLAGLGAEGMGRATGAFGEAAGVGRGAAEGYAQLLGTEARRAEAGREQQRQLGKDISGIFVPWLQSQYGGGRKRLPSRTPWGSQYPTRGAPGL